MVLDASVHLIGPDGTRVMPLVEFYKLDGMTRNVLQPGEFMLKITLPDDVADWTGSYRKLRVRDSWISQRQAQLRQHGKKAIGQPLGLLRLHWKVFQEDMILKLQNLMAMSRQFVMRYSNPPNL